MAYKNFLASQNIILNAEDEYREIQEDHLEDCWKEPPRSVYSCTACSTAPTGTASSVSGLTDPKETEEKAYQEDKAMLQQLQETTTALQHDTTVQDNLALFCKTNRVHLTKTDKLEAWKFERQEESTDDKFKDMNTAMEKNQESIMNAINSKNSIIQAQIDQLVKSVLVLNTSMRKQQDQVDSLQKRQEEEVEQSEGAKRARCGSSEDEYKDYMDELEDL
eukprot:11435542-Ditylum_brightwellii.AAC.1